jgi:hypothetical protein
MERGAVRRAKGSRSIK